MSAHELPVEFCLVLGAAECGASAGVGDFGRDGACVNLVRLDSK